MCLACPTLLFVESASQEEYRQHVRGRRLTAAPRRRRTPPTYPDRHHSRPHEPARDVVVGLEHVDEVAIDLHHGVQQIERAIVGDEERLQAGPADAPVILLMHGFPASSHMFRELMPRLAGRYHVIAFDLPGFGFTRVPKERNYVYSFDALAKTADAFVDALALKKYALYVFDYGAPVGLRLAVAHP